MAILDIFKKKPAAAKVKTGKEKEPKQKEVEKKPAAVKKAVTAKKGQAWRVLAFPHVTEKATDLEKDNKYVFRVFDKANKTEIKKAIESLYGVDVEDVAVINIPRKKRRSGRQREGWRKGYKKAIVRIQKGQKIEIMPR
jgi:large subunit ribosomal protein L23